MKKLLLITSLFLLFKCLSWQPAKAQYDGSFNALYFGRSIDAKTASLGSIGAAVPNNTFSVHQNSALLGFQEGYSAGYSHSSPYYNFLDFERRFDYFGLAAKPFKDIAFGISQFTLHDRGTPEQRLSTITAVYTPGPHFSFGANARQFRWDLGTITDNEGNILEDSFAQWYVDATAAARFPYLLNGTDARITAGLTFENILRQELDGDFGPGDFSIELPSIVTAAVNNELHWKTGNNFFLSETIAWSVLGEYQNVLNYDYRTRYSLGTQFGFNNILLLRAGYYYATLDDFGQPENKSALSEFTYGAGANVPVSKIIGSEQEIVLSIDYTRMPQPLLTEENRFNFGDFSTVSVALQIVL